ncbi:cobalamin biosynthesis protein CobG [Streptomyces sp. NPDC088341]|uniref:cobalamin biosynthesis protein CobG n=1 Tax=Streptomyces sp. NPDC088341 TaxID=3154870 RepID=UPI00343B47AC
MLAAMPPTSPTPANRDEAPSRAPLGAAPRKPARASVPDPVRVPVREAGDACPGALRLHAADDGRLARLRLPGGLLTYRQVGVLASAAERLGDGHVDITSRGNVQLRGLGADANCGAELADLLYEAGLLPSERHERVRNIVASPLAGLDGFGVEPGPGVGARAGVDARAGVGVGEGGALGGGFGSGPGGGLGGRSRVGRPQLWARELDDLLCASEAATALSGRFLFALDDGRGDVAALGADVTLLARRDGTAVVYTGANRSGLRVDAADAPRAALLAAETFLTVAEAGGSGAWRVRELPPGHGLDVAVASRLTEAGIAAEYVADRAATATTDRAAARAAETHPGDGEPPLPGAIHSPDGTVALSVHAPLGRLSAAQWRLLTSALTPARVGVRSGTHGGARVGGQGDAGAGGGARAGGQGGGQDGARGSGRRGADPATALRVTPWRGVIVPGLEPAAADDLLKRLRIAGLITDRDSPWYGVGACTGRPGCGKALADVRADAAEALRGPAAGRDALPVYWSGCDRRCGHPQGARVDVVATTGGGYRVSVRGGAPTAAVTATATDAEATDATATGTATETATATATGTAPVTETATVTVTVTAPGPELADAVATARITTVTR